MLPPMLTDTSLAMANHSRRRYTSLKKPQGLLILQHSLESFDSQSKAVGRAQRGILRNAVLLCASYRLNRANRTYLLWLWTIFPTGSGSVVGTLKLPFTGSVANSGRQYQREELILG